MIAFLLLALLAPSKVLEFVDPQADRISIQALVRIPDLGAKDLAKLNIIVGAIPKQTLEFSRREMLEVTDGEPPRCSVTPDVIRLVVDVPPANLKLGLGVMNAMIRDATLNEDNLNAAAQEIAQPDYWAAALNPIVLPSVKLSPDEAQALYQRVFRPERIQLVVGGKFAPGAAEQGWSSRLSDWAVGREPKGYFDISIPTERTQNPGSVTTIDLVGAPIQPDDAALPARILSLFALGVGKGASLFRVVREKHAWSYRQDAVLSPTREGWIPRLLIACIPTEDVKDRVKAIKSDLIDDVNAWTPASRDRALGMAEAVFKFHVPYSPLYVLGAAPVGETLDDRTFIAGYWQMKTGKVWDADRLVEAMKQVSLDDLKQQASTILTTVIPRVLPGG
jgi:hypothetical protein